MFVEYEQWRQNNDGAEKTRAELKKELESKGFQQGKRMERGIFWINLKLKLVEDDEVADENVESGWNDGRVES